MCATAQSEAGFCVIDAPNAAVSRQASSGAAALINSAILRRLLVAVALISVTAGVAATMGGPADAAVFPSLHRGGK